MQVLFAYATYLVLSLFLIVPAALPPTPTSRREVQQWLAWFGKRNELTDAELTKLQAAFAVNGASLLGYSKKDCIDLCKEEGLKAAIGTRLYGELHAGTVL